MNEKLHIILHIINRTPFYVWAVLIYLFFIGIKSMKTRGVYLPTLFIIPCLLLAMKYKTFFSRDAMVFLPVMVLSALGSFFISAGHNIKVIKRTRSIEVPGNYATLFILLSFFSMKYYFGYLNSVNPQLALEYSFIDNAISGLFSGYFIGRAWRYTYRYFNDSK